MRRSGWNNAAASSLFDGVANRFQKHRVFWAPLRLAFTAAHDKHELAPVFQSKKTRSARSAVDRDSGNDCPSPDGQSRRGIHPAPLSRRRDGQRTLLSYRKHGYPVPHKVRRSARGNATCPAHQDGRINFHARRKIIKIEEWISGAEACFTLTENRVSSRRSAHVCILKTGCRKFQARRQGGSALVCKEV